jgi:hypothetical protein
MSAWRLLPRPEMSTPSRGLIETWPDFSLFINQTWSDFLEAPELIIGEMTACFDAHAKRATTPGVILSGFVTITPGVDYT